MPFSPSAFEWWQWLLLAVVAAIIWLIFYALGLKLADDFSGAFGGLLIIVGWIIGLAGLACAVIGVIRFIKWAWSS